MPLDIVNVQLKPAQALEVEAFETVDALTADEAGPGIEVRVEQRRAAYLVRLVHQQLNDRPRGRLDGEIGPAHDLLGQLEREGCAE